MEHITIDERVEKDLLYLGNAVQRHFTNKKIDYRIWLGGRACTFSINNTCKVQVIGENIEIDSLNTTHLSLYLNSEYEAYRIEAKTPNAGLALVTLIAWLS
jgi:hypothetical protein